MRETLISESLSDLRTSLPYSLSNGDSATPPDSSTENQSSTTSERAVETRISAESEVLNKMAGRLANYTGIEATFAVLNLLNVCKESSLLYGDRLPFKDHINWFTGLLRNQSDKNRRGVEKAFYLYVTQMSFGNHQRRMKEGRFFAQFFRGPPPSSLQPQATTMEFPGFREFRGPILMRYLEAQEAALPKHDHFRELRELIKEFRSEITNAFNEDTSTGSNKFLLSSVPSLVQVVHKMLGHFLQRHSSYVFMKFPAKNVDAKTLKDATNAYFDLNRFVEQMQPLIKAYVRLIDEHPAVISHLKKSPTEAIELYQRPDTKNSSDTISVDNPPEFDEDTTFLGSTDVNEDVISEPDINKPGFEGDREDRTNSWGTCAFTWLENLVAQARNAKWLWRNRKSYKFEVKVLHSGTPSNMITPWEKQIQLRDLLVPHTTFDDISALLKRAAVTLRFKGTIHAELIVAAELIAQDVSHIKIGISRPPCYVCYQVLKIAAEQAKQKNKELKCQPAHSSGLVWEVDLPDQLPAQILSETLEELSKGAAQTLIDHRDIITELAKEARHHTVHMRQSSFSSSRSAETVDPLESSSEDAEYDEVTNVNSGYQEYRRELKSEKMKGPTSIG